MPTSHYYRSPIVTALITTLLIFASSFAGNINAADGIVAVVNDNVILQSELEGQIEQIVAEMGSRGATPPPREVLIPQLLNRQIVQMIQLQIADRTGIEVSDDALNLTLQNIAERNDMTLQGLKDAVIRDGLSFRTFREDIRTEMVITNLRQRDVINRISVTPREIDTFLARQETLGDGGREYHLRHIMLILPEGATAEQTRTAEQRGTTLITELNNGADFAQLAINHSDGQNALQGGDLGPRQLGSLPDLFADAASKLKPGQHSALLPSSTGLHILYLESIEAGERHMLAQKKARHILIQTDESVSPDQARQKLISLRDRIAVGEDFAELARAHSDDPGSAIQGGVLGWVSAGQMVERFEMVMNSLEVNTVSEPVRTQYGWHLIEVLETREIDNTEEQLRRQAASQIRAKKADQEIEAWLQRMRDEAFIEIRI
ncbi:MAG: peptidylprolyl isomerase [Immundisolibacteraceae bacterium]|nr:peptidylprolyl isomerase [Immundisolibacteraceae bacterium]